MAESLETGLVLMAAGMGTVLLLLALLVFVIDGVSRASRWLDKTTPAALAPTPSATATQSADTELITVIGAAVAAYRRDTDRH